MIFTPAAIPDVIVIEPTVFGDDRGYFFESFSERAFRAAVGKRVVFLQDNHSRSRQGVLRGLHCQMPPHAQGKLVRVVSGEVFDVAVDIRKGSPTFGRWVGEILSDVNHKQLWIPPGFAHGYLTISESADFIYKTTDFYFPELETCISWNDPQLGINWPIRGDPIISMKDANGISFAEAQHLLSANRWGSFG
jgi:dTDP-4-dehydrorhamnose 3,5-epimerase